MQHFLKKKVTTSAGKEFFPLIATLAKIVFLRHENRNFAQEKEALQRGNCMSFGKKDSQHS